MFPSASGFTLVELLVVLSILAVLMSILVANVTQARRSAQAVVCRTRMRTLLQANDAYVQSWNRYPPTLQNTPGQWLYGWEGFDWLGVGHRGDGSWGAPESGLFWPYIQEYDAYVCPSDRERLSRRVSRFSYAINCRTGLLVPGSYTRDQSNTNLPRLAEASLPLVFEEIDPVEGCYSGLDLMNHRHNKKTNVGFADGHLESNLYPPGQTAAELYSELQFDPPLEVVGPAP